MTERCAAYIKRECLLDTFLRIAASAPANLKPDFKKLLTAMTNWRTEILAVLDTPITNAYTEALNGVAKTINRTGKGYSFEVLRARLMFRSPGARIKFGPRAAGAAQRPRLCGPEARAALHELLRPVRQAPHHAAPPAAHCAHR